MKDWPSGSYIVLECKEHRLFAVGYKYSLRSKSKSHCYISCYLVWYMVTLLTLFKVLTFVGSWNAGETTQGNPYIARFPDQHGNIVEKEILRPEVVSDYFKESDVINNHNKSCQGDLALEEHWRTTSCWFKLAITLIGITVTDMWYAVRHHCTSESVWQEMPIKRFAECIVFDLWNKPWGKKRTKALCLGMPSTVDDSFSGVEIVLDSPSGSLEKTMKKHFLVHTKQKGGGAQ